MPETEKECIIMLHKMILQLGRLIALVAKKSSSDEYDQCTEQLLSLSQELHLKVNSK